MADLLIESIPDELYAVIAAHARDNYRSMMQEALALLDEAVMNRKRRTPPKPIKLKVPITKEMIDEAKRDGRE